MKETIIYGLVCPVENLIMYVGKTKSIDHRLHQHMIESARKQRTPKEIWMSELQSVGLEPSVVVLEIYQTDDWQERESYWINRYRSLNPNLKNTIIPDAYRIRLNQKYSALLAKITKKARRRAINELCLLLDQRAQELGLTPVAPVTTKRMRKTKKVEVNA